MEANQTRDQVAVQPGAAAPDVISRAKWLALALLCASQFMVILDVSIVNVALPSIERSLHFSPSGLQWVASAYALTFGGFLLLGGRVADLFGRRRIFMVGLVVFASCVVRVRSLELDGVRWSLRAPCRVSVRRSSRRRPCRS